MRGRRVKEMKDGIERRGINNREKCRDEKRKRSIIRKRNDKKILRSEV